MSRPLLALLLCALALGGCSLGGDGEPAPASAVRSQLPPAPPSSPASVSLEGDDAFEMRFRLRPPRAGIVFDVESGDVLWRRRPLEPRPIASLTKVMTAFVVATTTRPRELRAHPCRRAPLHGSQRRGAEARQARAGGGAAQRCADHVGERRRDRAGASRWRVDARLRAADERAGAGARPRLHAVRLALRRGEGRPLVRGRSRGADAARDGRAANRADRPHPVHADPGAR